MVTVRPRDLGRGGSVDDAAMLSGGTMLDTVEAPSTLSSACKLNAVTSVRGVPVGDAAADPVSVNGGEPPRLEDAAAAAVAAATAAAVAAAAAAAASARKCTMDRRRDGRLLSFFSRVCTSIERCSRATASENSRSSGDGALALLPSASAPCPCC